MKVAEPFSVDRTVSENVTVTTGKSWVKKSSLEFLSHTIFRNFPEMDSVTFLLHQNNCRSMQVVLCLHATLTASGDREVVGWGSYFLSHGSVCLVDMFLYLKGETIRGY